MLIALSMRDSRIERFVLLGIFMYSLSLNDSVFCCDISHAVVVVLCRGRAIVFISCLRIG